MTFTLPELPYAKDALEPYISAETLEYHYGKHHNTYVNNLNKLIAETDFAKASLEDIIKGTSGGLFNNAAQVWNHTFYWNCLTPDSSKVPTGALAAAINDSFGSFDDFKNQFTQNAVGNFGSGWTWLVKDTGGALSIVNTSNADTPMTQNKKAILTCDVWEHAYYIDYRNARPDYLGAFWNVVNWDFANRNFEA